MDIEHRLRLVVLKTLKLFNEEEHEGGANWWFDSYFMLPTKEDTHIVRKSNKKDFRFQHIERLHNDKQNFIILSPEDASNEIEGILRDLGYEVRDLVEEILED